MMRFASAGFEGAELVLCSHQVAGTAEDTRLAVGAFIASRADLVLFCGGDGTARDVCGVTGKATPVLGIPAGVKMYSGVFGVTPARTAEVVLRFLKGETGLADVGGARSRRGKIPGRRMGGAPLHGGTHPVRADPRAGRQDADRRGA